MRSVRSRSSGSRAASVVRSGSDSRRLRSPSSSWPCALSRRNRSSDSLREASSVAAASSASCVARMEVRSFRRSWAISPAGPDWANALARSVWSSTVRRAWVMCRSALRLAAPTTFTVA